MLCNHIIRHFVGYLVPRIKWKMKVMKNEKIEQEVILFDGQSETVYNDAVNNTATRPITLNC